MPNLRTPLAVYVLVLVLICAPEGVAALTVVTNTGDDGPGSLRVALASAPPGDTIAFAPGVTGSIVLLTTLTVTRDVTIQGPGAGNLVIDGQDAVRVIDLTGGTLSLSGVTIANALSAAVGGGILVRDGATLNVSRCVFVGNAAPDGGAIAVLDGGDLSVSESFFDTNTTSGAGGGALLLSGTAVVRGNTFIRNTAAVNGGAINVQPSGVLTLLNNTLFDNTSGSQGGAMSNLGTATVINNTFAANHAPAAAGLVTNNENVTLYNNVFSGNITGALTGSFPTSSHNVFFDNGGAPADQTGYGTANFVVATAAPLGPLQNNGLPTLTMLPVPLGAARCAGSHALVPADLLTDQRGFLRIRQAHTCVDAGSVQTGWPGLLPSGSVTDPPDDAIATPDVVPSPDLVSATVGRVGTNLLLIQVRFKPGTYDQTTPAAVQVLLDIDRDPTTGSQCSPDPGVLGAEFIVEMGGSNGRRPRILRETGPPPCESDLYPGGTTAFVADGMNTLVPVALLGYTDGRLLFRV